ncbi:MAG TPA: phenylalanine--tRNA ligase subunit beta [Verrucomicrobiae bacterium]|nr:phenylalanine--tRNA ligase subunit beta [Verrucomicrobiae bacterium]
MNLSLAWLREFVATTTPAFELGEKFRMTSSEAEGLTDWSTKLDNVVVGKVLKVKQHPNADRLRVATVDVGTAKQTIVCGAKNLEEGQHVIVALPGATLQPTTGEPLTIKEAELRGVRSEGMLCALEEIGVPLPSEGIFVFDEPVKPGTSASKALFEDDAVIDLEITPNRPDLLSHAGLAREVATFERRRLGEVSIASIDMRRPQSIAINLRLSHHKDCFRYSAIALEDVQVKPSPWWMQSRLLRCGIRPINVVVDITNYVMLEVGQPLHAFDADTLMNSEGTCTIGARSALTGEKLAILDDTTRDLAEGDIVIVNGKDEPIGLAGIMGGSGFSIEPTTTRILLEAATFNPARIRKTSRRLGLRSEASLRFEKGLDTELTITALKRAVYLLQELAGAKVASKMVDSCVHSSPRPRIHVSFDRIHQLLGVRISAADCKSILIKLGFQLPSFTKSGFDTVPPSWRRDVTQAEDVIEELIRIWGYDRLPYTLPIGAVKPPARNVSVQTKRLIRHALAAAQYRETLHITFCSAQALEKSGFKPEGALALPNPLSAETAYLSPSHVVGMLNDCGTVNNDQAELQLFEIGKTFLPPHEEKETLTLLVRTGGTAEQAIRKLKGTLERLCTILSLPEPTYRKGEGAAYAESGHTLDIYVGETLIGTLALVSQEVVTKHKVRRGREIVAAEITLDTLLSLPQESQFYVPMPQYPVSVRDLTVTISPVATFDALLDTIRTTVDPDIVRDWHIADIFTGKSLKEGHKAVTLRLTYNASSRTLSDEEIKVHHTRLEQALQPFTLS